MDSSKRLGSVWMAVKAKEPSSRLRLHLLHPSLLLLVLHQVRMCGYKPRPVLSRLPCSQTMLESLSLLRL
jgi:hypothetical protein